MENSEKKIIFSEKFCTDWQYALAPFFKTDKNLVVVKNLAGKKSAVYLPYLNYTNISEENLPQIMEYVKANYQSYNIRTLDFNYKNFQENDTVTMRMELKNDAEFVWKKTITSKARNHIKKALKSSVTVSTGKTKKLTDDFFLLYKKTMKSYGTPAISRKIFSSILEKVSSEINVAYVNNVPASSLFIAYDGYLAWVPWSASDKKYNSVCPTNLVYWQAIQNACKSGIEIFDFGRSPFGGQTYMFKKQWGTYPVKISILSDSQENIYGKYEAASKIWRMLPDFLTDFAGPILSKHLSDL